MTDRQPVHSEHNWDYKTMKDIMYTSKEVLNTAHWLGSITSNFNKNILLKQMQYSEAVENSKGPSTLLVLVLARLVLVNLHPHYFSCSPGFSA
jgi:hypothetical protein